MSLLQELLAQNPSHQVVHDKRRAHHAGKSFAALRDGGKGHAFAIDRQAHQDTR